ncbi:hypothetical protein ACFGVR_23340 [Mucilaginibacter sp. AW1-3]
MFLEKDKPHRLLLLGIGLLVVILGILLIAVPPGIYPDPSWGFQVMRCMEQGYHFNLLVGPDPADIAKNHSDFLSWWSPGQYLLPYFFKSLFKLNTGHAVALTVTLCNILGLAGFYQLFKKLGFTKWIAAISVTFIASQQFFLLAYIIYTGGEVLLFAFAGWFLYGCFSFKRIGWQLLLFIFVSGLVGFFAKSSALWMFAAGLACIWINLSSNSKKISEWLRNGVTLGIPAAAAVGIIIVFYLSKGENPSSATAGWAILPETFSFPLASPLLAGFSLDELFKGLIYHPDGPVFSYGVTILILAVLAFGSLALIITILKTIPNKNYALALIVFYVVANVFFSYLYLKQAAISYEGRHFRILGLLAIPGIIWLLSKTRMTRGIFAVIWIVFICLGVRYFIYDYKVNKLSAQGNSGLTQGQYDKTTLDEIARLDSLHHNDAIFVFVEADIAVEVNNNRVITLDIESMDNYDYDVLKYAGKGGTIYMLMPESYVKNGVANHIGKSFTSYHNFSVKQLSKEYYLFTAEN